MMHYMACPEIINVVAYAMEPVVGKIISKKKQNPEPPSCIIQFKQPELVYETKKPEDHGIGHKANQHVAYTKAKTGERVLFFVIMFIFFVGEPCFDRKQYYKP